MGWWPFRKKEEAPKEPAPAPTPVAPPPAPRDAPGGQAEPVTERAVPAARQAPAPAPAPAPVAPAPAPAPPTPEEPPSEGTFALLARGLRKTAAGLKQLFGLKRAIDDALLGELEVKMYEADFGPETVAALLAQVRHAWKDGVLRESDQIAPFLQDKLLAQLTAKDTRLGRAAGGPTVILIVGVNGTGKTTSIAKVSHWLAGQGNKVILAAGDTFRAAATEQLQIWSERVGVPLVTGGTKGGDPAAVAFSACERALAERFDYLIIDTAGRLHTQANLMRELEKIRRVIAGRIPGAPHETLLVLDATTGQNAVNQAEAFNRAATLTGLFMAKLDGTAKGGILVTLHNKFQIPVKFVGLGEKVTDLAEFSAEKYVKALFA